LTRNGHSSLRVSGACYAVIVSKNRTGPLRGIERTLDLSYGLSPMVLIRQYDPTADYSALRACFVELQTWEQSLEPGLPAPEEAADPYLTEVFRNCAENSGRIFLAEADGAVVGFICVLAKVPPSADDGIAPYAYISDLVVRAAHRGRGIGRELMMRAESFAREFGAKQLKVGVLVRNELPMPSIAPVVSATTQCSWSSCLTLKHHAGPVGSRG
jgi:GNAT superfamily N-acetyltransferase